MTAPPRSWLGWCSRKRYRKSSLLGKAYDEQWSSMYHSTVHQLGWKQVDHGKGEFSAANVLVSWKMKIKTNAYRRFPRLNTVYQIRKISVYSRRRRVSVQILSKWSMYVLSERWRFASRNIRRNKQWAVRNVRLKRCLCSRVRRRSRLSLVCLIDSEPWWALEPWVWVLPQVTKFDRWAKRNMTGRDENRAKSPADDPQWDSGK